MNTVLSVAISMRRKRVRVKQSVLPRFIIKARISMLEALTKLNWQDDKVDNLVRNHWPSTQLCMECKHGIFVMNEDEPSATYVCSVGVQLGPCESVCEQAEALNKELANDPIDW